MCVGTCSERAMLFLETNSMHANGQAIFGCTRHDGGASTAVLVRRRQLLPASLLAYLRGCSYGRSGQGEKLFKVHGEARELPL